MNTEPLKPVLDFTNNKQDSIVFFLNDNVKSQLNNYYLYDKQNKDIFVNQNIICIKRNDLSLDIKGKIISVKKNKIGINVNNIFNKFISFDKYYIFLKNSRSKADDRVFFEALLQNLG